MSWTEKGSQWHFGAEVLVRCRQLGLASAQAAMLPMYCANVLSHASAASQRKDETPRSEPPSLNDLLKKLSRTRLHGITEDLLWRALF